MQIAVLLILGLLAGTAGVIALSSGESRPAQACSSGSSC